MHKFLYLIAPAFLLGDPSWALEPPVAPKKPHREIHHGEVVIDDYYWLRDKDDRAVKAYIDAENAYTESATRGLNELSDSIYRELRSRVRQTDLSAPIRHGNYLYYTRTERGEHPVYCRKYDNPDTPEEVLLDLNRLGRGMPHLELGVFAVSDDHDLFAYTLDTTGLGHFNLYIKNLRSGELLPDSAARVSSVVWAGDNKTIFFTSEDSVSKRSDTLWRMSLGGKVEQIYVERDPLFSLTVTRTKDKAYLLLVSSSADSSETRALPAHKTAGLFQVVWPREKHHKYQVEHRAGQFYITSNKGAKNFRVVVTSTNDPTPKKWQEFVAHRPDVYIEMIELFADYAVVHEKSQGLSRFRIYDFIEKEWHVVAFPELTYSAFIQSTPTFDARRFRFGYQSMVTPMTIYDYNMATRKLEIVKRQEVLGEFDPTHYASERLWATALDGTKIPISIVYKKGVPRDGNAALLLMGYGAYGVGITPIFSNNRLSLLERGVIYAIAHVRGGNELGEAWYEQGRLLNKKNTFTDFIAVAEHLIANKWTRADKLAITGGSAGGLLIAAVLNMRPELFRAAHLDVPFVDVLNTMWDASIPLTIAEYPEWGNPREKSYYDYLKSYCPYTNLARKKYPAILVTASYQDSQVMYWEPMKYIAKLRALNSGAYTALLKVDLKAGHAGATGRRDAWRDTAFEYAWILHQLFQ